MHWKFIALLLTGTLVSCRPGTQDKRVMDDISSLAESYVRLALDIGQYDEAFVDAYYGPDSLKPSSPAKPTFPKESFLQSVQSLSDALMIIAGEDSTARNRALWMTDQLKAFDRRIRIYSGETGSFDDESKELFGVSAPVYSEDYYKALVAKLNNVLPGDGPVANRFQELADRFIIPKDKLDTVFQTAINYCRKKTLEHYKLPASENFVLEFVNNKSWNGYNWYKGNYHSLIQINIDLNIFIDRAIDVGSHESYPGHHVYNMLLEQKLYREKGYVEMSVYPLYSPQSLIAEGSANYGIDVVFPGKEKARFAAETLLPLAGLDTIGIDAYFLALEIKGQLNYIRNEVGRKLLSGSMSEETAVEWLQQYGLYNEETARKSIQFIRTFRSYVINYNYGLDLVKNYIESRGGTVDNPVKRWELFGDLLSRQVRTDDLLSDE